MIISILLCTIGFAGLLLVGLVIFGIWLQKRLAPSIILSGPRNGEGKQIIQEKGENGFVELVQKYGKTFLYEGTMVTCDPELVKPLLLRKDNSLPRSILYRLMANVMPSSDGILLAEHADWDRQHKALTAIFRSDNLEKYALQSHKAIQATCELNLTTSNHTPIRDPSLFHQIPDPNHKEWAKHPLGYGMGYDFWTFIRFTALRFLMYWGYGLDPDCQLARILGREVDYYVRIMLDVLPYTPFPRNLKVYVQLWYSASRLKRLIGQLLEQKLHTQQGNNDSGKSIGGGAYPNFISQLADAGFSLNEITSIANHANGAHKAIALITTAAMFELCKRPTLKEQVRQELLRTVDGEGRQCPSRDDLNDERLPITNRVLQETLRHHVVSFGVMRKSGEPIKYKGNILPPNTEVGIWLHALHHDPDLWVNPTAFDPDRWKQERSHERKPNSYFPFLDGLRRCAGMHAAKLEFTCMLHVMLTKFNVEIKTTHLKKKTDMFVGFAEPVPFTIKPIDDTDNK